MSSSVAVRFFTGSAFENGLSFAGDTAGDPF